MLYDHPCRHSTTAAGYERFSSSAKVVIGQRIKCDQPPAGFGPRRAPRHGCLHSIAICLAAVRSLARKGNQISASREA